MLQKEPAYLFEMLIIKHAWLTFFHAAVLTGFGFHRPLFFNLTFIYLFGCTGS